MPRSVWRRTGSAFLAAGILSAWTLRTRSRYPIHYSLSPEPLSGLSPQETAALEAMSHELGSLGFQAAGDFRTDFAHGAEGTQLQIEQERFWISTDRKTLASLKRVSYLYNSQSGFSRISMELSLFSWSADGKCFVTSGEDHGLQMPVPDISQRQVIWKGNLGVLIEGHRRHQEERRPGTPPCGTGGR